MNPILRTILALFLATGLSLGASLSTGTITGDYVEARTADVFTGPALPTRSGPYWRTGGFWLEGDQRLLVRRQPGWQASLE
jgi:hypothetical protein